MILPQSPRTLRIPHLDKFHPLNRKLVLVACRLSGKLWKTDQFRAGLPTSLWNLGEKEFCDKENNDHFQSSLNNVLDFLTELFESGIGYSAINTARSALSVLGIMCDGVTIGAHPVVIRYLKGAFNLRPSVPRHSQVLDVSCVLKILRGLSSVKDLSLKNLSLKLVMLMSLITASRTQSLHLLTMEGLVKDRLGYTIQINGLVKQARPGFCTSAIQFKAFPPDRRLCVVTVMKEYLRQTAPLRQGSTSLLI